MSDHLRAEVTVPASLTERVREALDLAARERVAERLRAGDATLWAPEGAPEVADRLGWLTIAERMGAQLDDVQAFADEVRDAGLRDVVLLGMGGSSLAPEVLRRAFGPQPRRPRLHVLDSTDPDAIRAVQDAVEPARTLFLVSSKSGGTIEPLSLFAHFFSLVPDGGNFAAITDPGSGLERLAAEHGFRRTFAGDPDIGGRYSALSPFGIVPGALAGFDVRALVDGAAQAWSTSLQADALAAPALPAGVWLGAALAALARAGRDKLTFLISPTLPGLGLWLEQLFAESTGKQGTGILPVADEPPGDPSLYGGDRVFAHLPDVGSPDAPAARLARSLADAGHPLITIPTAGPRDLGRVFLLAEIAVAIAGWGLRINPFDQPNVQQAKDATKQVLDSYRSSGTLPAPADDPAAVVSSLLLDGAPPEYVAIMAYAPPSPAFDEAAAQLRAAVRARTRATTTFGYGPRFLHSTGQFHKGGPPAGRFLQLLHDADEDVDIPEAPYSFATLEEAQAIGDLQTLRGLGLPAARLRLHGADPAVGVREFAAALSSAAATAATGGIPANQASRPGAG